jgi:hypothetical protein
MDLRWNGSVVGKRNAPTSSIANGIFDLASIAAYQNASAWPTFTAAFSPLDVANMTLWLDATTGLFDATTGGSAVTADASAVARWEDQSGNARHFTQATSNDRPVLKTSVLNSRNVIRFDGSNDKLTGGLALSNFVSASAHSVFVVGKAASVATNNTSFNYQNAAFYGDTGGYLSIFFRSTGLVGAYNWDGTDDAVTTSYAINTNAVFYSQLNGGSIRLRLNGGTEASASSGSTQVLTGTLELGRQFNNNSYCLNGDIAEVIFFNAALSATDREKIEGYLAHRWGLTAGLPVAHPYKTTAP